MDTDSALSTLGLLHYLRVLRRRWYAVAIGASAGIVAGLGFLVLTPTTSTASTSVDLKVVSSDPFNLARPEADLLNRTTEEQTARSPAVIAGVAETLDRTVADVRSRLEVVVLPDSTVMQLRYTAEVREEAVRAADALAEAFLAVRSATNADRVDRITAAYDRRLDELRQRLADTTEREGRAEGAALADIQADQAVIRTEIDTLLQERSRLTGVDTTGGAVIASASDNRVETAPNRPLVLGTGLLAGLVLGLIAAFAVDGIDRRIRDRHDVADIGCGPVLASLRGRTSTTPSAADDVDEIRSLREHLLAAIPENAVVTVADMSAADEPTDVAVNLALEMAAAGVTTDLVLAEYPQSTVDRIAAALEMRRSAYAEAGVTRYQSPGYPRLRMQVTDPTEDTVNPSTTFVSRLIVDSRSGDLAPMTIIALPPRVSRSLVLAAGRLGTSVVTVCTTGHTQRRALGEVAEELSSVNAVMQGTVLLTRRRPWSRATRSASAEHDERSATRI